MARRFVLFVLAVTVAACLCGAGTSAAPKAESPSVKAIARDYKTLKLITPEPVEVDPELAMLCRGVSQEDVEAARKKHGVHAYARVSIYMSDAAAQAFATPGKPYPVGAVIVKEKQYGAYTTKGGREAGGGTGVGGMVKRDVGFDPAHGDWEYFYFQDAKRIESGRIASCVQCHIAAGATDHVFGTWAKRAKHE